MTSRSRPVATSSPFSSSKSNTIEQEQPHLSAGAYIRSLIVKQMSSSSSAARSKDQHLHTMSSSDQQGHEQAALKPQVKKQTRRRVHTSRPYQERLLNMAEARREIVTALRIHRANMRQQSNKYQQEQRQQPRLQQPVHQVIFQEQSQAFEGVPRAVDMSYASSSNNHLCSSPLANLIAGAPVGNYSPSSMLAYDLTPLEEEAPAAAIGGLEQLACSLPAQPLWLNLSFQDFDSSLDNGKNSDDPFGVPSIQSSSCPAASSYSAYSSPVTAMAGHGSLALRAAENKYSSADAPAALSQLLDGDGEMLYSIGGDEMQGMELSETSASVAAASACWTKILECVESGGVGESAGAPQTTGAGEVGMVDDAVAAAGLPEWQWLCDGVGVEVEEVVMAGSKSDILETMHVDDGDYSGCYEGDHGDNGGDIALPCIDIEGWDDGEWFS